MKIITAAVILTPDLLPSSSVAIRADRLTLAKRRWRAVADDQREFGFDLELPLANGDAVFATENIVYRIVQQPEAVLEITLQNAADAARLGWLLGNLHFQIAVSTATILAPADLAIRQMLEREHIDYRQTESIFRPLSGGHSHGHGAY